MDESAGGAFRGKRLLALCPYPFGTNAGQRLKFEQYYDDWRSAGLTVDVAPFMDRRLWDIVFEKKHYVAKIAGTLRGTIRRFGQLRALRRYDIVYVFMWGTPVGTSSVERLIRALSRRLIYDIEDNVIVEAGPKAQVGTGRLRKLVKGSGKARYLIRHADYVVTSSPALNERCRAINLKGRSTYITSSVDTDRFEPAWREATEEPVVIGWTGTFSSSVYLDLLRSVFQRLAQRRRFRLRVIGNFDYEVPGVDLEVLRWNAEEEVVQLQGIDIGVYPLALEDWVSGKSGLKAIQYMAFGLPCVATNVGTTPQIIRDGENGVLVRDEDEWLTALERLIDDPALRRRLGEQARKDALANYSTKAVAAQYRRVLEQTLKD